LAEQGVTVVVPTLNRGELLADCLRDLLAQRHRPLEILVVDQSAEEPSAEVQGLTAGAPEVIAYHRVDFRGLPRARNYGWQRARHDAILYVDDDVRCGPELAGEHLRALNQPGVGAVGGGIDEANKPADPGPPTGAFNPWLAEPGRGFGASSEMEIEQVKGCNFSAWRSAIRAVGGFDEALDVGAALYEEAEFCLRLRKAGYLVWFNGRARLTHLAAAGGGCRVGEAPAYVFGLAFGRGLIMRRHLQWFHWPSASVRVKWLALAYAFHYRQPRALAACAAGLLKGFRHGRRPVACTDFRDVPRA
jgi:GT2 family glycosyltransferase